MSDKPETENRRSSEVKAPSPSVSTSHRSEPDTGAKSTAEKVEGTAAEGTVDPAERIPDDPGKAG